MAGGQQQPQQAQPSTAKLAFLVVGVWVMFILLGWAQEGLMSKKFGENQETFNLTWTLMFLSSCTNCAVAAVALKAGGATSLSGGVPAKDWLIAGTAYLGAAKLGLISLKFIIYPMQVLVKSCKAIPVMFGEVIFDKNVNLTCGKIVSVTLLCAGVVTFTMGQGSKKKKAAQEAGEEAMHLDLRTFIGLGLVLGALLCDGIYGPYQNKIRNTAKENGRPISGYHNMFNMNKWQGIIVIVFSLILGEPPAMVSFMTRHPEASYYITKYCLALAGGQIFIFQLQADFGALTVTKTTTVRKLISVIFSVLKFGHNLHTIEWLGILTVFVSEPLGKFIQKKVSKPDARLVAPIVGGVELGGPGAAAPLTDQEKGASNGNRK